MTAFNRFERLSRNSYDLIMADPPWSFKTFSKKGQAKSPSKHYDCMSLDDICNLDVASLAKPDCALWLWTVNAHLLDAIKVLDAWGFSYSTQAVWCKRTRLGKLAFGTGYRLRGAHEPILIGTRGKPKNTRSTRSVIEGPVREHSQKPEEAYSAVELWMPNARRLDLFSRQERAGWDCFGNETDKFEAIL